MFKDGILPGTRKLYNEGCWVRCKEALESQLKKSIDSDEKILKHKCSYNQTYTPDGKNAPRNASNYGWQVPLVHRCALVEAAQSGGKPCSQKPAYFRTASKRSYQICKSIQWFQGKKNQQSASAKKMCKKIELMIFSLILNIYFMKKADLLHQSFSKCVWT